MPVAWAALTVGGLAGLGAVSYVMTIFSLFVAVIALEPRGDHGALERSKILIKGVFWRTLGVLAILLLISIPGMSCMALAMQGQAIHRWGLYSIGQILHVLVSPIWAIAMVVWYQTRKTRQSTTLVT